MPEKPYMMETEELVEQKKLDSEMAEDPLAISPTVLFR
jgi:hypothetical protein